MASAKSGNVPFAAEFAATQGPRTPKVSQTGMLLAYHAPPSKYVDGSQYAAFAAYQPPAPKFADEAQAAEFIAYQGDLGYVTAKVAQDALLIAYKEGIPGESRQGAWTFILDGHRFYVLPLGPEGDWAYDTTTQQWIQLQTQGFDGMNFQHGVMWDIRIIGGDALYGYLYELDPNQPFDEAWREIEHTVTGQTVSRNMNFVTVGNFRLTATVGDLQENDSVINLRFSDDNGNTWSNYYPLTLQSGNYSQLLIWQSLGGFRTPGRIFEISDSAGLVGLYGADARFVNYDDDPIDEEDQ